MARAAPDILAGPGVKGERPRLCWAPRPPLRHAGRSMDALPETLRDAFDPERFRREGHALVDQLADYLRGVTARARAGACPGPSRRRDVRDWAASPPEPSPAASLGELMTRVLAESNHLHHPRYVGHQVTAPLPLRRCASSWPRCSTTAWRSTRWGRSRRAMERAVIAWLAQQARLRRGRDGVLTSGGSAGNLTALLAARQAKAGFDAWTDGAHGGPPLAVLASSETHYCVERAAQIMGWGAGGVVPVPVDARFRLRPEALPGALAAAEGAGRKVIARGRAARARRRPARSIRSRADRRLLRRARALAPRRRRARRARACSRRATAHARRRHRARRLGGVGRAQDDADAGAGHRGALPRRARARTRRFAQEASYLFASTPRGARGATSGLRTLECTKRMMSLKLYAALAICAARAFFADYVDGGCSISAAPLRATADAAPDFELAVAARRATSSASATRPRAASDSRRAPGSRSAGGSSTSGALLPGADHACAGACTCG